jgi:hypothetical protein
LKASVCIKSHAAPELGNGANGNRRKRVGSALIMFAAGAGAAPSHNQLVFPESLYREASRNRSLSSPAMFPTLTSMPSAGLRPTPFSKNKVASRPHSSSAI